MTDPLRVLLRVLPSNTQSPFTIPSQTTLHHKQQNFTFDAVGDLTQAQVFDKVGKEACEACLQGRNTTILAYGQTGTGKTYTMMGRQEQAQFNQQQQQQAGRPYTDLANSEANIDLQQATYSQTGAHALARANVHIDGNLVGLRSLSRQERGRREDTPTKIAFLHHTTSFIRSKERTAEQSHRRAESTDAALYQSEIRQQQEQRRTRSIGRVAEMPDVAQKAKESSGLPVSQIPQRKDIKKRPTTSQPTTQNVFTPQITEHSDHRGMIPRCFEYIFERIAEEKLRHPTASFTCTATFSELYNETIYDLLDPESRCCQIREDANNNVFILGVTEEVIENATDAYAVLNRGSTNRHISATAMNRESSRSHTIFSMMVKSKRPLGAGDAVEYLESKFNLVDLAGSERQTMTQTTGIRLKEAGIINKSLLALGIVIQALVMPSQSKRHVNYRDSKLTFLLRESLGGNAKTILVANISSNPLHIGESLSTLKFAQRAKLVQNSIHINADIHGGNLEGLQKEIGRLRDHVEQLQMEANSEKDQFPQAMRDLMEQEHAEESDRLRDEISLLMDEHASHMSILQNEVETSKQRQSELQREIARLQDDLQRMSIYKQQVDAEVDALRSEAAEALAQHEKDRLHWATRYQEEKEKLTEIQEILVAEKTSNENLLARIIEYERLLAVSQSELQRSQIKLEEVSLRLGITSEENLRLHEALRSSEQGRTRLEHETNELRKSYDLRLKEVMYDHQNTLDTITEDMRISHDAILLHEAEAHHLALETAQRQSKHEHDLAMRQEVEQHHRSLDNHSQELKRVHDQALKAEAERHRMILDTSISELRSSYDLAMQNEAEQHMKAMEANTEKLKNSYETALAQKEEDLRASIANAEMALSSLETELTTKLENAADQKFAVIHAENQSQQKRSEELIESLKSDIAEQASSREALQKESELKTMTIAQLQAKLDEAQQHTNMLMQKAERQAQLEVDLNTATMKISEFEMREETANMLAKQLTVQEQQCRAIQQCLEEAERNLGPLKAHNELLLNEKAELAALNTSLKEENAKLVAHNNHKQRLQYHVKIKQENNDLRQTNHQLQTKLEAMLYADKEKENVADRNIMSRDLPTRNKKKILDCRSSLTLSDFGAMI